MFSSVSNQIDNMSTANLSREHNSAFDASTSSLICLVVLMAFGLGYFLGDQRHSREDTSMQAQSQEVAHDLGPVSGRFGRVTSSAILK
ncbi:MAG TPA: hypothetical protein V6C81_18985 [Planktothrix sp.]|jgi:hypothetical protein